MDRLRKSVSQSRTEQVHIIMSAHINGAGYLFGGQLMEWIDVVAGVVARRHAGTNVVTASVDNLQFKSSVRADEIVTLVGVITCVGKTSMEVRVDTFVESLEGDRKHVNRAYLTMVTLKKEGQPVIVPELALETDEERAEWESGIKRREIRLSMRVQ